MSQSPITYAQKLELIIELVCACTAKVHNFRANFLLRLEALLLEKQSANLKRL